MKKETIIRNVSLDRRANVRTIVALAIAAVLIVSVMIHPTLLGMAVICPVVVLLVLLAMWKAPWTVSVDDEGVKVGSSLSSRRIPFSSISSVERADVTGQRPTPMCSSGILGYWGNYESDELGTYQACYGDASSCFLITTTDGKRHVLGCNDPEMIIATIRERIAPSPVKEGDN